MKGKITSVLIVDRHVMRALEEERTANKKQLTKVSSCCYGDSGSHGRLPVGDVSGYGVQLGACQVENGRASRAHVL